MPIMETLDIQTLNLDEMHDADAISVGEAFARLYAFVTGDSTGDAFKCDTSTWQSVRRAAPKVLEMDYDKTSYALFVQRTKDGKNVWMRVGSCDENGKLNDGVTAAVKVTTNDKTKVVKARSHKSTTVRTAIKTLRDERGIRIRGKRVDVVNGTYHVALTRTPKQESAS